jgi:ABC-type transporter Mla maintaining outer membrane lipid asymmetry permease subunit MlaE
MGKSTLSRADQIRKTTSISMFFRYLGHLFLHIWNMIFKKATTSKNNFLLTVYYSGAKLVVPVVIISSLLASSLIFNIYRILSPLYLQNQILIVAQNILFYDLLPFVIGLIFSIQLSFHLVNLRYSVSHRSTEDVIKNQVIPLILGANFSALLLYVYSLNAILISIYFCFKFLINADLHEYLFHLSNTISNMSMLFSILKTLIYCTIISLVVGYYYYQVASAHISITKAMSRIRSRSFLYLTVSSVYFKFFSY